MNLVYAHLLELHNVSIFDEKGRLEIDRDLAADPSRPRSKGTNKLMALMGAPPGGPPR